MRRLEHNLVDTNGRQRVILIWTRMCVRYQWTKLPKQYCCAISMPDDNKILKSVILYTINTTYGITSNVTLENTIDWLIADSGITDQSANKYPCKRNQLQFIVFSRLLSAEEHAKTDFEMIFRYPIELNPVNLDILCNARHAFILERQNKQRRERPAKRASLLFNSRMLRQTIFHFP